MTFVYLITQMNMVEVAYEFVAESEHRLSLFGKFT